MLRPSVVPAMGQSRERESDGCGSPVPILALHVSRVEDSLHRADDFRPALFQALRQGPGRLRRHGDMSFPRPRFVAQTDIVEQALTDPRRGGYPLTLVESQAVEETASGSDSPALLSNGSDARHTSSCPLGRL